MEQPNVSAPGSRVTVSGPALCNPLPEIDDPRRAEVISQISSDLGIVTVDSSVRALLWLADVEALETLLEGCKRSPSVFRLLFVQGSDLTNHALGAWRGNVYNARDDASEKWPGSCRERDGSCVITRNPDFTESVNVYPHRLEEDDREWERTMLWDILGMFWTGPRVAFWRQAALGCGCTNEAGNTILLHSDVSDAWANLGFALKPLEMSQDCRSLTVQFYWLPGEVGPHSAPLTSAPAFGQIDTARFTFNNSRTNSLMRSGDIVVLRTKDPRNLPLPSFQLLEMQWYLHRAAVLG